MRPAICAPCQNNTTLINQEACLLGKNRSDLMLEAACERAQNIVLDQMLFELDGGKFSKFAALLDMPAEQSPGLERLLAIKTFWQGKQG